MILAIHPVSAGSEWGCIMSSLSLITSGVAWFFAAAAVLAFLLLHKALSGWIKAGIGGAGRQLSTAAGSPR